MYIIIRKINKLSDMSTYFLMSLASYLIQLSIPASLNVLPDVIYSQSYFTIFGAPET